MHLARKTAWMLLALFALGLVAVGAGPDPKAWIRFARQRLECRRDGLREETRNLWDVSDASHTVPARAPRAL